ncbi:MAG: C-GCAxxG-C-C family protein [Spirochaetia bacterium]
MDRKLFINEKVRHCYWDLNINCASTVLKTLAAVTGITISQQVIAAAKGMHGAGGAGEQCGLVEGMLMFLGVYGTEQGRTNKQIAAQCSEFAKEFTKRFSSVSCSVLRPEGFTDDNPPHLCEGLTVRAIEFAVDFLKQEYPGECRSWRNADPISA